MLSASLAGANSQPEVIVEISPAARDLLNARVTRRLIQLELAEVKIAPHPARPDPRGTALYYRLLRQDEKELRIELWELGEFYGARRVSTAHGNKKLLARHVALATAELAQRLSRTHTLDAKKLERQQREALAKQVLEAEARKRERWSLSSQAQGAWLPRPRAWLFGPSLGVELNQAKRGRLYLSSAWLFGKAPGIPAANGLTWLELRVSPCYRFDEYDLAAGADLAAASVGFTGPVWVDQITGQKQTWSARAGAQLSYQPRVSDRLRLKLNVSGSILLRPVPVASAPDTVERLRGLWLGLSLGLLVDS